MAAFEVTQFPEDWGKAAAASRFLVGAIFLGQQAGKEEIACAGWNLAGFALAQTVGQPGNAADGPVIFKLRAKLEIANAGITAAELRHLLESVAAIGEDLTDAGEDPSAVVSAKVRKAAKQIPWFKLAMAIFQVLAQFGQG